MRAGVVVTPETKPARPYDYIWDGYRVTYYLNHAGVWQPCPASEAYHYTLRASPPR